MTWGKPLSRSRSGTDDVAAGYTLFEILLSLAIVAIILAAAVPLIGNLNDPARSIELDLRGFVRRVRSDALSTGQSRQILITRGSLESSGSSPATLPDGWELRVRRFGERDFRPPAKIEIWDMNSAGICEPLSLQAVSGEEVLTMEFDPLTALEPPR